LIVEQVQRQVLTEALGAGGGPPLTAAIDVAFAHVLGEGLQVFGHDFVWIGRRQRHANFPEVATFDQGESLAFWQADDVCRFDRGTLVELTRSGVLLVKSVVADGAELSVASLTSVV
jgi:hypothetical protein